jgi:hypothetical protein
MSTFEVQEQLIFLIGIVGVHSTLRPPIGLLCQPRVIMMMEKLVERLTGETEVLGENMSFTSATK